MSEPMQVAIVDYGMGNLHNVRRACAHVGLETIITSDPGVVRDAAGVILPGVGAMPEAMAALEAAQLADAVRDVASRGTPLFGVCLGLQLLFSHGTEFGDHAGLGILSGRVERFPREARDGRSGALKVPHVGWTEIVPPSDRPQAFADTVLATTPPESSVYFVHSYHAIPDDPSVVVANATYGGIEFVAAVARDNVFACQFHPERSGPAGLEIYRQFGARVASAAARSV